MHPTVPPTHENLETSLTAGCTWVVRYHGADCEWVLAVTREDERWDIRGTQAVSARTKAGRSCREQRWRARQRSVPWVGTRVERGGSSRSASRRALVHKRVANGWHAAVGGGEERLDDLGHQVEPTSLPIHQELIVCAPGARKG